MISAAVSAVIAIGFGVYGFGGFSQQLPGNIPIPDNPFTSTLQNVDTNTAPNNPNIDPALVSRLMAEEELSQDAATLIAQIDTQIKDYDSTYLNYEQTLPGQAAWDVQIRAIPDQVHAPTEAELQAAAASGNKVYDMSYSFEDIGGVPQLTMRYFVPYEAMSEELRASLQSQTPPATAAMTAFLPHAEASEGASGAVFETVIKGIVKEGLGKISDKFGPILSALGNAIDIAKLKDARSHFSELDSLEACANNPTNPLTKKAFAENPEEMQKTLDSLKEARAEVTEITAVRALNLAAKTGAKFTGASAGGKIFLDSVAKWNDKTLEQVSERWMDDARKAVVQCDQVGSGTVLYSFSKTEQVCALPGSSTDGMCEERKEESAGSGIFSLSTTFGSVSGNGTGVFRKSTTAVTTSPPKDPLMEYGLESKTFISGDIQIRVSGVAVPFGPTRLEFYADSDSLSYEYTETQMQFIDGKLTPWQPPHIPMRHNQGSGGFSCVFDGVDIAKAGTYEVDMGFGAGSCKLILSPS